MTAKDAIRGNIEMAQFITNSYLKDLSDTDLLVRSVPGANHIAWQLGHLIAEEREMIAALGHPMPELPSGFAEAHAKGHSGSDDATKFAQKDEYLALLRKMHDATLSALAKTPDSDLDTPAPEKMRGYAPTIGAIFNIIGQHEMMHVGQFVPVRRKLGKPIAF
jgi:hypothetical protein